MSNFGLESGMRVLETRVDAKGLRHRRYETETKTTFWTVEIPREVWRSWARSSRHAERFEKWQRAQKRDQLFLRVHDLKQKGWKTTAISHELDLPERTVYDWVRQVVRRKHMVRRD